MKGSEVNKSLLPARNKTLDHLANNLVTTQTTLPCLYYTTVPSFLMVNNCFTVFTVCIYDICWSSPKWHFTTTNVSSALKEYLSQNIHCSKMEKHGLEVQIFVCVETNDPLNQALSKVSYFHVWISLSR